MKNVHFLLWMGVGGILAYAVGEFLRKAEFNSLANYFIWSGLIMIGGILTARQNKNKEN